MNELKQALLYMRMQELRETCKKLNIPFTGLKGALVKRIVHFLETGKVLGEPKIPEVSKAKKEISYPLHPDTLILYGSYKNDYAARDFMKILVGNHFHFTAAGIDWIKERWADGKAASAIFSPQF